MTKHNNSDGVDAPAPTQPQWICPRCKVDRLKEPCGDPHHPPCALTGTTSRREWTDAVVGMALLAPGICPPLPPDDPKGPDGWSAHIQMERQACASRHPNHNNASDQQTAHEARDGDVENIYQEACRWLMGLVDDESFRAYIGEYLRGVREMASQPQAPSMSDFLSAALSSVDGNDLPAAAAILRGAQRAEARRALNVKGMSAAQKQAFREFVQADAFGVTGATAHSKSEYKRRVALGDPNVLHPARGGPVVQAPSALVALRRARDFIRNGVELGFIRMPDADCPDPAHETPRLIDTAIAELERALGAMASDAPSQIEAAARAYVRACRKETSDGVLNAKLQALFAAVDAAGVSASDELNRVLALIAEYGRAEYVDGSHNTEETLEHKERMFTVLSVVIRDALGVMGIPEARPVAWYRMFNGQRMGVSFERLEGTLLPGWTEHPLVDPDGVMASDGSQHE